VNDAVFRQAEKDWFSFVEKLTERLTEIDETVPELPVKDVVCTTPIEVQLIEELTAPQIFRIYRDVRFSKDPTYVPVQQKPGLMMIHSADALPIRPGVAPTRS
jgi:uncharacterized protein (DUF2461 family)